MILKLIKNKIVITITLVVVCIISFISIYLYNNNGESMESIALNEEPLKQNNITEVEEPLTVEIKGAVINPGVYKLKSGSRVIDVVNLAGGFNEWANTRYINLSKKVTDEMSIIIYTNEEVTSFKQNNLIVIEEPCECPEIKNDACLKDITDNNLISINDSSMEDLLKIPGIGESKAKAIIEYREENKFNKIEDILNVSGIGQKLFDAIKEYIKV